MDETDLRLVWLKTSISNMIFICKLYLNAADSYLKKKFNKEKRRRAYGEENADTYEFKTAWDAPEYFKYLGEKK